MRHFSAALVFALLPCASYTAFSQAAAPNGAAAPPVSDVVATSPKPSELLQPALTTVRQTLDDLRIDKWKDVNGSRDDTAANIKSIRGDLEGTLPGLLATADAAPGTISKVLPVFRNVEALYDVLLRIVQTGAMCAPRPQSAALEQAIGTLDTARRALGEQMQGAALAQEQLLQETQAALRARPVAAPAVAPAPIVRETPPAAKPKAKPRPRPKPKPATDGSAAPATAPAAPKAQ